MGKISPWQYLVPVLILLSTLAVWSPAAAQSGDPLKPEPLSLTDEQGEYPLGLHLEILEDPGGELTINEVSSPEFDSRFTPSQVEAPNYGFTDSAYWVRFRLDNETRRTVENKDPFIARACPKISLEPSLFPPTGVYR